ncbi:MAG: sigma-70 family RNA polymerase sigma factor [Pseudomonadota bacterium]
MTDSDTIFRIFVRLRSKLAKSVSGIVPPKEIEDIVQETYIRVSQAEHLDKIRRPESFLYRTARNLALDHVKRAEFRLVDSDGEIDERQPQGPADREDETYVSAVSDEEFAQFCDAVRYLPEQCRRAFVLRKVYGFSQREIAELMSISISTVEKHIASGTRKTYPGKQVAGNRQRDGSAATVTNIRAARRNGESSS